MAKPFIRVLGVMTGTSCDAIDASCLEFDSQGNWDVLWQSSLPYPLPLKKRVLRAQDPNTKWNTQQWLTLHRDLGSWYGKALQKIISHQKRKPDVIANHGQTIAHFPPPLGMTLQLGDPSRISLATGLTVLTSFREGDMAAGGQGAPLVPRFHYALLQQIQRLKKEKRAHGKGTKPLTMAQGISVHNIGGISNFAYYGPHHQILAFDTGPGNIWIDAATEEATQGRQKYDKNGRLAKQGTPDFAAIKRMLKSDRYYRTKPPKSTGRDQLPYSLFKKSTTAREESLVATATQMTVESIALSYEKWILQNKLPLAKIYLCGGGSQNGTLLQWLQKRLAPISIETLDEIGGSSQFAESQAFAFLGYLTLIGQPLGGLWTGAQKFGPPGHLVPGKNWIKLMRQLKSFEL